MTHRTHISRNIRKAISLFTAAALLFGNAGFVSIAQSVTALHIHDSLVYGINEVN